MALSTASNSAQVHRISEGESPERRLDDRIGSQRLVDWALVRDLEQPLLLLVVEWTLECDLAMDALDLSVASFATVFAVLGVDAIVRELDDRALERPTLSLGVHLQSHRSASTERGQEEVVRAWTEIVASEAGRFICDQLMFSCRHGLRELAGSSFYANADGDRRRF
jgi:hypothetical protein